MINISNTPKAYSEVYSFLNVLGEKYILKIPQSVYSIIEEKRDKSYNPTYLIDQEVTDKTFSQEALALIAALNLQYFCKDENVKKQLKQKYIENTKKEEEKYSYDNIFKNTIRIANQESERDTEINTENTHLIEYEEAKWYIKIWEKVLNIFKGKWK